MILITLRLMVRELHLAIQLRLVPSLVFLEKSGLIHFTLAVESVKGNICHLEWAAGMASIIKTILFLQYEQVPADATHKQCII